MDRFIDAAVEQFAHDHTEAETDLYVRLREETYRVMQSPQMQVDVIEGRFLQMLVRRLTGNQSRRDQEQKKRAEQSIHSATINARLAPVTPSCSSARFVFGAATDSVPEFLLF
jgi:predicted O-methyltransferase YrrM